ncbi:MAG: hypothetical protein ACYCQJ_15565 [Nitrososphaerales archaeon]
MITIVDQREVHGVKLGIVGLSDQFNPTDPEQYPLWSRKGEIIDLESKQVYTRAGGYVHPLIISEPIMNQIIAGQDFTGCKFYPGYEGVYLRTFRIKGELVFATQKSLDAKKSRWLDRPKIFDLFQRHVDISQLPTEPCSWYLLDPSYTLAGSFRKQGLIKLPFPELTLAQVNAFLFPIQFGKVVNGYEPGEMNFEDGQVTYQPTLYDHPFLHAGDSVVMEYQGRLYRLMSPAYAFRYHITNGNGTPYHEFCLGLGKIETFTPLFVAPDPMTYWHQLFVACVSPHWKPFARSYLTNYQQDIYQLTLFIRDQRYLSLNESLYQHRFSPFLRKTLEHVGRSSQGDMVKIKFLLKKLNADIVYALAKQVNTLHRHRLL